jgi:hypothetical protein
MPLEGRRRAPPVGARVNGAVILGDTHAQRNNTRPPGSETELPVFSGRTFRLYSTPKLKVDSKPVLN